MNGRILELIKNPVDFQNSDLEILNREMQKNPFMQSIRALHLLGTHRLKPEQYQNELSVTAAYTTDKKILYQLVNFGSTPQVAPPLSKPENQENVLLDVDTTASTAPDSTALPFTEIQTRVPETPNPVTVDGQVNRILFEGEEDFLDRPSEMIDLESTLESGKIVTQKIRELADDYPTQKISVPEETASVQTMLSDKSVQPTTVSRPSELPEDQSQKVITENHNSTGTDGQSLTDEIITAESTDEQTAEVHDPSALSFHGTDDFLPEVKINPKPLTVETQQPARQTLNKHEEEMKRLVAEVEAKLKATRKQKKVTEEDNEIYSTNINFAETQELELPLKTTTSLEMPDTEKVIPVSSQLITPETLKENLPSEKSEREDVNPSWKPMSFAQQKPDALIQTETKLQENITAPQTELPPSTSFTESAPLAKDHPSPVEEEPDSTAAVSSEEASNIPKFINTWQAWLKIDRQQVEAQEKIEISITEIKNRVIENFIEKEPKISRLKEETEFVIKERNDDISHLMTETLANLYVEQKLYSKAINAFGILIEKHPEKKGYFNDKIKSIKDLRQNK